MAGYGSGDVVKFHPIGADLVNDDNARDGTISQLNSKKYIGYNRIPQVLRHISTVLCEDMRRQGHDPIEIQVALVNGRLLIGANQNSNYIEDALQRMSTAIKELKEVEGKDSPDKLGRTEESREYRHYRKLCTFASLNEDGLAGIKKKILDEMEALPDQNATAIDPNATLKKLANEFSEEDDVILQGQMDIDDMHQILQNIKGGIFENVVILGSVDQQEIASDEVMHAEQSIWNYCAINQDKFLKEFNENKEKISPAYAYENFIQKNIDKLPGMIEGAQGIKIGTGEDMMPLKDFKEKFGQQLQVKFKKEQEEKQEKLGFDRFVNKLKPRLKEKFGLSDAECTNTTGLLKAIGEEVAGNLRLVYEDQKRRGMILPTGGIKIPCALCAGVLNAAKEKELDKIIEAALSGNINAETSTYYHHISTERIGTFFGGGQRTAWKTLSTENVVHTAAHLNDINKMGEILHDTKIDNTTRDSSIARIIPDAVDEAERIRLARAERETKYNALASAEKAAFQSAEGPAKQGIVRQNKKNASARNASERLQQIQENENFKQLIHQHAVAIIKAAAQDPETLSSIIKTALDAPKSRGNGNTTDSDSGSGSGSDSDSESESKTQSNSNSASFGVKKMPSFPNDKFVVIKSHPTIIKPEDLKRSAQPRVQVKI